MKNLTWLDLSGNRLTAVPESIEQLGKLTWLNLSGNNLTALSESIKLLKNLTRLDLSGNRLTAVPESIEQLGKLTELDISGNPLPEVGGIPQSLIKRAKEGKLTILGWDEIVVQHMANHHYLTLDPYEESSFVSALCGDGANGRQLDLSSLGLINTRLERLSPLIQECGITWLDLSCNDLTKLPESMGKLEKLTWLDLRGNPLLKMKGIPQPLIYRYYERKLDIIGLYKIRQDEIRQRELVES